MDKAIRVLIPLLNPNEPEAMLAAVFVKDGQQVNEGDVLCTLETTKSAADLEAEASGYVVGQRNEQGQTVTAGDTFCYLAQEPDWTPEVVEVAGEEQQTQDGLPDGIRPHTIPDGVRITQPAIALARQYNLDLARLPQDDLITESIVRAALARLEGQANLNPPNSAFDPTAILVYGGGGHGKALIELLRVLGTYRLVGVVDDGMNSGEEVLGTPVLGGGEVLLDLFNQGVRLAVNAVGGIGNLKVRLKVFNTLAEAGFACPAVQHPTAFSEASASLSPGCQVFAHAYVGSETRLGYGVIVNTGAIVSHDCELGDYVNISPGAMLAGGVKVGAGALIGMGATVNLDVRIGTGARIGNGATVKSDVPEKGVVRAGLVWPQ